MRGRLHKPTSDAQLQQVISMASPGRAGFTYSCITGLPWEDQAYYEEFTLLLLNLARQPYCRRINLARLQPWPSLLITSQMVELGLILRDFSFQEWN